MNTRKRTILIAIISGGTALAIIIVLGINAFKIPATEIMLKASAEEVNKMCPMMLDTDTRIDSAIVLPGKILQYNYTLINTAKNEMNPAVFAETMEPLLKENLLTNPQFLIFKKSGTTFEYRYLDKNAELIALISLGPDEYGLSTY